MEDIPYQCPECGSDIRVKAKDIGKIIHCPNCAKRVFIQNKDSDLSNIKTVKVERCPYCGRPIFSKTENCKHCGKSVQ